MVHHGGDGCGPHGRVLACRGPRRASRRRSSAPRPPIVLGFSQVGAESGWRTANTKSVQEAAKAAGINLKFSDAQQKQENQITAIRSYIQQKVDVIAFSPVVETGWDAVLKEAKGAEIPVILTDRAVDSKDTSLYKTFIGSDFVEEGKSAGEWVVEQLQGRDKAREHRRAAGHDRLGAGQRPQEGLRATSIKAQPAAQDHRLADRRLHPGQGQGGHGGLPEGATRRSTCCSRTTTTWASARSRRSRRPGKKPGKDIKIVTIDAVKDGMAGPGRRQDQLHRRVQPAARPAADGPRQEGRRGRDVPTRIVTKETTFTQEQAKAALPSRKY